MSIRKSAVILTGHQPNFLPYTGFFHKLLQADHFLIVDHVQFVKRGPFGWIHRNRIRTSTGSVIWLTVPVRTKGRFDQRICDVEIDPQRPWAKKLWRSIEVNYSRSPFFTNYAPLFEDVFIRRSWITLVDLNIFLIKVLMGCLDINLPVGITSQLGIASGGSQLIVDMCQKVGADTYLSGVHGQDYLDQELIRTSGIQLVFQQFQPLYYPQHILLRKKQTSQEPNVGNEKEEKEFVENLSILDMLFSCGREKTLSLLREVSPVIPD